MYTIKSKEEIKEEEEDIPSNIKAPTSSSSISTGGNSPHRRMTICVFSLTEYHLFSYRCEASLIFPMPYLDHLSEPVYVHMDIPQLMICEMEGL